MTDEEVKMNGTQFEGKEVYVKDVFTEIAGYYDEMNEIMSLRMIPGWHRYMSWPATSGGRSASISAQVPGRSPSSSRRTPARKGRS